MTEFVWADEKLVLYPEKALFWPRRQTLMVADVHFGKAATFRSAGIPVPHGTTAENLARLDTLLQKTHAKRLIFLGDLFHAKAGRVPKTIEAIAHWRERQAAIEMILVRGNHDRHAGDPDDHLRIVCVEEPYHEAPFDLCHEPLERKGSYVIAGHVHPAISLWDSHGTSLRTACFWFQPHLALIPAFGSFTGTFTIRPRSGDTLFAVGEGEVIPLGATR